MSWFKRGQTRSPTRSGGRDEKKLVEEQTRLEVYERHWQQILAIIQTTNVQRTSQSIADDIEAVLHYISQMMCLLIEEHEEDGQQGPILRFTLSEDLFETLFNWANKSVEYKDKLKFELLKMFEQLISQARQRILVHKPIIRPLMRLLSSCADTKNTAIEKHLVLLLHQLCVCLSMDTQLLELFFNVHNVQGPTRFLIFSLLIPYVHHEGNVGQQARDALLLIMSLSSVNEEIGRYIAENSDFCPVLATGLSGLYSSLPRKLDIPSDDWSQLEKEDWINMPDLVMFLNSLEFCNAVAQVAHPHVRDQLLKYISDGFLIPVLGPALHQDISGLPMSILEKLFVNSMDEVIAATAYLDLFIRRITEPMLMRTFLKFVLTEHVDEINILESLITRINSNSRKSKCNPSFQLCMVSLSLFRTLVDLNCEDIMHQLIFKYLVECNHVMVSQKKAVRDPDLYGKAAEKFLALLPKVVSVKEPESPTSDSPNKAIAGSPPSPTFKSYIEPQYKSAISPRRGSGFTRFFKNRSSVPDIRASVSSLEKIQSLKLEHFETSYSDYLAEAKVRITQCVDVCKCWTSKYDGVETTLRGSTLAVTQIKTTQRTDIDSIEPVKLKSHGNSPVVKEIKRIEKESSSSVLSEDSVLEDSGLVNKTVFETPVAKQGVPKQPGTLHDSAESVTSEADSLLSNTSFTTAEPVSESRSGSDSPLVDNFDNRDFNSFIMYLKRIQTPVEFCDNIEDSIHEMDEIINDLKTTNISSRVPPMSDTPSQLTSTQISHQHSHMKEAASDPLIHPRTLVTPERTHPVTPTVSTPSFEPPSNHSSPVSDPMESNLTSFGNETSTAKALQTISQNASSSSLTGEQSIGARSSGDFNSASGDAKTALVQTKAGGSSTKKQVVQSAVGPFLSALLTKLEGMMQNSLYVNLLLTGLLARLAYYPQPLLRSFLLNHNLVFQPSVKSLIQVLHSVKSKVESYAKTLDSYDQLLLRARRFLAWREDCYMQEMEERTRGMSRTESMIVQPGSRGARMSVPTLPPTIPEQVKEKKRGSLSDFLFRRQDKGKHSPGKTSKIEYMGSGNYKYINRKKVDEKEMSPEKPQESLKTKNAVYCTIVLEEFLKELAAISQEHALVVEDDGYFSAES